MTKNQLNYGDKLYLVNNVWYFLRYCGSGYIEAGSAKTRTASTIILQLPESALAVGDDWNLRLDNGASININAQ